MYSGSSQVRQITLVEGDGIGPEICDSVRRIFSKANVPIKWDVQQVLGDNEGLEGLSKSFLESAINNKVILKGPLTTPVASGHRSLNLRIRRALNLFANVRPCYSVPGLSDTVARYKDVDLIIIRENTEGEYSGIEHAIGDDCMVSVKVTTDKASRRVARFAFDYAVANTAETTRKVTVVHQRNYLPKTDGLFCQCCSEVAKDYVGRVQYELMELEQACLQLTIDSSAFDILLMPNLYGDIVSDMCAGMIGGLGLTASANLGEDCAMFEAVHGSAPDITGKDLANPTALLLSGLMMLDHLQLREHSSLIRNALWQIMTEQPKLLTRDVGGSSSRSQFTDAVCSVLSTGEINRETVTVDGLRE